MTYYQAERPEDALEPARKAVELSVDTPQEGWYRADNGELIVQRDCAGEQGQTCSNLRPCGNGLTCDHGTCQLVNQLCGTTGPFCPAGTVCNINNDNGVPGVCAHAASAAVHAADETPPIGWRSFLRRSSPFGLSTAFQSFGESPSSAASAARAGGDSPSSRPGLRAIPPGARAESLPSRRQVAQAASRRQPARGAGPGQRRPRPRRRAATAGRCRARPHAPGSSSG